MGTNDIELSLFLTLVGERLHSEKVDYFMVVMGPEPTEDAKIFCSDIGQGVTVIFPNIVDVFKQFVCDVRNNGREATENELAIQSKALTSLLQPIISQGDQPPVLMDTAVKQEPLPTEESTANHTSEDKTEDKTKENAEDKTKENAEDKIQAEDITKDKNDDTTNSATTTSKSTKSGSDKPTTGRRRKPAQVKRCSKRKPAASPGSAKKDVRKFSCEKCEEVFGTKAELNEHVTTHQSSVETKKTAKSSRAKRKQAKTTKAAAETDNKEFGCSECDFVGKTAQDMAKHSISHGENPDLGNENEADNADKVKDKLDDNDDDWSVSDISETANKKPPVTKGKRTPSREYFCSLCDFWSRKRSEYKEHLDGHDLDPDTQKKCLRTSFVSLVKNRPKKPDKELKVCHICGVACKMLKRHLNTHNSVKNFKCDQCDKTFADQHCLRRHKTCVHTNIRNYICEICGAGFKEKYLVKQHVRYTHSNEHPFPCNKCDRRFKTQKALNRHYTRLHMKPEEISLVKNRKIHQCDVCGKIFACSSNLKDHVVIHTGEKPYSCQFCGKKFTDKYNRYNHEKLHKNIRPHKCTLCDKAYLYPKDLKRHLLKNHMIQDVSQNSFESAGMYVTSGEGEVINEISVSTQNEEEMKQRELASSILSLAVSKIHQPLDGVDDEEAEAVALETSYTVFPNQGMTIL